VKKILIRRVGLPVAVTLVTALAATTPTSASATENGSERQPQPSSAAEMERANRSEAQHNKSMGRRVEPNPALAERAKSNQAKRSHIASGLLRDRTGAPLSNAKLRLDLEPSRAALNGPAAGSAVALVPLDQVETDGQGRFRFTVPALGDMSGYLEEDGTASVLVSSMGGVEPLLYHLIVRPDPLGEAPWIWVVEDERVADAGQVDDVTASAARQRGGKAVGLALREGNVDNPDAAREERTLNEVNGYNYCGVSESPYWQRSTNTSNMIKNLHRIQRVYIKGTVAKWTISLVDTKQTTVDAAASVGGGALFNAGWTRVQESSSTFNTQRGSNTQMDLRREFEVWAYHLYCRRTDGSTYYSGVYEWRPLKPTGTFGFGTLNTAVFNCDPNKVSTLPVNSSAYVSNGTTTTMQFSVGAVFNAVSLRTGQQMSTSNKYTMGYHSGSTYQMRLCGNGGYYYEVAQAREV
jgi:hypothetical protein